MNNNSDCLTFLVDDQPASEDAFSSEDELGAHERVATSITETLTANKGGRVIGLEGTWGSGKSTVVNLVLHKLAQYSTFRALTFDAWAHEGDPLRRTFLETLFEAMRDAKWVADVKWSKKLDQLANRRKSVTTTNTRKPTAIGLWIAISLMVVPIGSVLVTDALRDYAVRFYSSQADTAWQFMIGLALAVAPITVLVGRGIFLLFSSPFRWKSPFSFARIRVLDSWAFIDGKSDSHTISDSTETPNPTSLEFAHLFRELMSDALGSDESRRFLIVIDNLDRADADDALRVWSTMQTFLQDAKTRGNDWFTRFWVLVPYDPEGLRKLWEGDREVPTVPNTVIDLPTLQFPASQSRVIAESFFEKSFQVRFQVPPLIFSDWKSMLSRLLIEALPGHSEDDRHSVYRVIDYFRGDGTPTPTPRHLKAIVNQIGVVHRQRGHEFRLDHIAYFVLQRMPIAELVLRLRAGSVPVRDATRLLGDDLRKNLAGLAFNVSPKRGMELLLTDSIYELLAGRKESEAGLITLCDEHGDSFWQTLERLAGQRLTDTAPAFLGKVASTIANSKLLEVRDRREKTGIVSGIRSASERVEEWTPFDIEMARGISSLLQIVRERDFAINICQSVKNTLATFHKNAELAVGTGFNLAAGLVAIFGALRATGNQQLISGDTELPVSPAEWTQACKALLEMDPDQEYWSSFKPSCGADAVMQFIVAAVGEGRFGSDLAHVMRVTQLVAPSQNWSPAYPAFRNRLDVGSTATVEEICWLLNTYGSMKKEGKQSRAFDELLNNGHVLHHFHRATQEKHQRCRAICAYHYLLKFPNCGRPAGSTGNSESGFQLLEKALRSADRELVETFLLTISEQQNANLLFLIVTARNQLDAFVLALLRRAIELPVAEQLFTAPIIQKHWKLLKENFSDDPATFSRILGLGLESHALASAIQNAPEGFQIAEIPLYTAICDVEGSPSVAAFAEWCSQQIARLTKEQWEFDFANNFRVTELCLVLAGRGVTPKLSVSFSDALEVHAKAVAKGAQYPPGEIAARWSQLLKCIESDAILIGLRTELVRVAADFRDGNLSGQFFELYADELHGISKATSDLQPLIQLLINLVKYRRPESGLRWAAQMLMNEAASLREQQTTTIVLEQLKTRARESLLLPGEDSSYQYISEIGRLLEV